MTKLQLVAQGAEARLYFTDSFLGKPAIIKERFTKTYRHPSLDSRLRQGQIRDEVKSMVKARKSGIDTPTVYFVDTETSSIYMEFIEGKMVRDLLINQESADNSEYNIKTMREIGKIIGRLHDINIVHGDLTTSNILVRPCGRLVMIDFGLSYVSTLTEDKAVDLYVLERAFLSTHPGSESLFEQVLSAYASQSKNGKATMKRLEGVRLRGRKRDMVG